jgi:polyisoprenyl-phosphate glycosyltransferase
MTTKPHLSIVSPVYRAEEILPKLVSEIEKTMLAMGLSYEIILVDDRSPDNSWQVMQAISAQNPKVKSVRLSRNFGQHPAIMAGLSVSQGEWVVVMDCDLQDQPKEIAKLYAKAQEGYEVVMARRVNRQDGFFKKLSSTMFSKVFNYLSDTKINHEVANFGIYHHKVIAEVLEIGDCVKSFPLFVYYVGFKQTQIEIEHAQRDSGSSSYTLSKLLNLAFNSIIAYSNKPLRLFIRLGGAISLLAFLIGLYYLGFYLFGQIKVPGYASIIVSLSFLCGIIICAIGVVGVYLGRVFEQTKNRKPFIIETEIN